jgi:hypothetical protein
MHEATRGRDVGAEFGYTSSKNVSVV